MSVTAIFGSMALPSSSGDRVFRAVELSPGIRIAKTSTGRAAVLASTGGDARPPIVMRHLRVDFGATCQIDAGGASVAEQVTIVECLSDDDTLVRHFLLAVTAVLGDIATPTAINVRAAVDALVEAFRAMSKGSLTSVQGLWGELFVIRSAADPGALIDAWHVTPQDRHDFGQGAQRLEVKTTTGRVRRHRFAHEQLIDDDLDLVIASLMVESSPSGVTISDLIDEIVALPGIDADRRIRLLAGVTAALGDEWAGAERQRFDAVVAFSLLKFFDVASVPKVDGVIPDTVTDLRYAVDLSAAVSLQAVEFGGRGGLFAAALPTRWVINRSRDAS
jgi:hypothetical protein